MSSDLKPFLVRPGRRFDTFGELATHALESMLLALVAERFDLSGRGASKALVVAAGQAAYTVARMRGGEMPPRLSLSEHSSELRRLLVDPKRKFDALGELAVHVLDSLMYALAAEGIDVSGRAVRTAVETTAQSLGEWMSEVED